MELMVASTPYSQWRHLNSLLQQLGWNPANRIEPEQCTGNAAAVTSRAYLLLYTPAHIAIAYALDQGQTPSVALQQWQTALRQCLRFYRRHRRQTLLINVMHAVLKPQIFLRHCRQRFGIHAKPPLLEAIVPPTTLSQLLAQQLVLQQPELLDVLQELEAGTTPLLNHTDVPDIDIEQLHQQLVKQAQTCAQQSGLLSQLEEKEQENNQLLAQLHQVQEELEALHQQNMDNEEALHEYKTQIQVMSEEHQRLQASCDSLKQGRDKARAELQYLQQDKKDVEEENEMLLQQLHQVQEELEHYYLNNQGLTQQLSEQRQQIQQQNQSLQSITASASWKLTAPIRSLGKALRPRSPERRELKKQLRLLAKTELFDADWYLATYPDVAESGMDPREHYLKFGADEGRNPSVRFDTDWYRQLNPSTAESNLNPLVHYLKFGQEEAPRPNATA
ncbi:hypothetical protein [Zobellella aerophila]|uniref:Chromosome partitioning protein ParA n=1 Tax=Zobellella aerophila TaxID=870480 RepID=A0ABP6V3M6_9GAMM